MNLDKYVVVANEDHKSYEFYSEGPKGPVRKVILYRRLTDWSENVFNLGFGDWDEKKQDINDKVTSNNNDREKILATVAATVLDFTERNPGVIIYAEGTTPSRTRLYQMRINANWDEISKLFDIYSFKQGEWKYFERGCNYEAFVVIVKK
jgi:hypothetical protein